MLILNSLTKNNAGGQRLRIRHRPLKARGNRIPCSKLLLPGGGHPLYTSENQEAI